jgi:hypothetical protein
MTKTTKLMLALAVAADLAAGCRRWLRRGARWRRRALRQASTSALVTAAAKELGVARARLKQAIVDAATARVDEAVDDGDLEADDADEYKAGGGQPLLRVLDQPHEDRRDELASRPRS